MAETPQYQHVGVAVARVSTDPGDLELPGFDLDDPAQLVTTGRDWLAKTWARADVREALTLASPALAARVDQFAERDSPAEADVRRAVLATASYLMRWQRRATPFGLFAAVAAARTDQPVGPATENVDRVRAAADAEWIDRQLDMAGIDRAGMRAVRVVADVTAIWRDGRLVTIEPVPIGVRMVGPPREVSVAATRPVRAAMMLAATPIRFDDLTAALSEQFPSATTSRIDDLVHGLVQHRMLVPATAAGMTCLDPLGHLVEIARTTGVDPGHVNLLADLHGRLRAHNAGVDSHDATRQRGDLIRDMQALSPAPVIAVDVVREPGLGLPATVLRDAQTAAGLLLRLSTRPYGSTSWMDYQARFLERYGPGALVPVRDLLSESGLGYPTGYLGAVRERPTWRTVTERDVAVLSLIQQAHLAGADEVVLTDTDLDALTIGDPSDRIWPPRVEIGFQIQTVSTAALTRGEYRLRICAAPRDHTSMIGRFLHLLDPASAAAIVSTYRHDAPDVEAAQLTFPPRRSHNRNVTRVPQVLPTLIALGEHADGAVNIDDLAVTCDAAQMFLVRRSTGRRVAARTVHALDTTVQSPLLARFLAEVDGARSAMFGPFDLGTARTLPHTPRIRYQRIILSPARWQLSAADLAHQPGTWDEALARWCTRWRVPAQVVAVHGELRLPLDLHQPLDRAVLQTRLDRAEHLELHEDAPPGSDSWARRPTELIVPLIAAEPQTRPLPPMRPAATVQRPATGTLIHTQIIGNPVRFDDILRGHAPAVAGKLLAAGAVRWWFSRHRSLILPDAEQRLDLFVRLAGPDAFSATATAIGIWVQQLDDAGLAWDLRYASATEQPGRYGTDTESAETAFEADSRAALAQLELTERAGISGQAVAAASMVRIATGLASRPCDGWAELVRHLPHRSMAAERAIQDTVHQLADPARGPAMLAALPGGPEVMSAWRERDDALSRYASTLDREPGLVLRSLLHDHQARALGIDPDIEQTTLRMARAAAQRLIARPDDQR